MAVEIDTGLCPGLLELELAESLLRLEARHKMDGWQWVEAQAVVSFAPKVESGVSQRVNSGRRTAHVRRR